jgi:hypothetical protein
MRCLLLAVILLCTMLAPVLLRWPRWLLRISACSTALMLGGAIVLGGRAGPSQVLGGAAWAHGDADWINQGGFRNAAGELCCGERDCVVVHAQHVTLPEPGYRVFETGELVPERDAQPSPDGQFWRCQWGGMRKCFFAPPEGN